MYNHAGTWVLSSWTEEPNILSLVAHDTDLAACKQNLILIFSSIPLPHLEFTVMCDISTRSNRPFLPTAHRKHVFDQHLPRFLCHLEFDFRKICIDINRDPCFFKMTQNYLEYQRNTIYEHTITKNAKFDPPERRFQHVYIESVDSLAPPDGFMFSQKLIILPGVHTYIL